MHGSLLEKIEILSEVREAKDLDGKLYNAPVYEMLGVTIDWDFIAAHRVGTEEYRG